LVEIYVLDVEIDLGLLLQRDGVEAEPLERLDLAFGVVNLLHVVDVLWRKNTV
jgi:hypothetical protein